MTDHMYCNCTELTHNASCPHKTDADRASDSWTYQRELGNRRDEYRERRDRGRSK